MATGKTRLIVLACGHGNGSVVQEFGFKFHFGMF